MAFTTSGAATGATLIQEIYRDGFINAVFYSNLLGMVLPSGREVFPKLDSGGGLHSNWIVKRAGNDSVELFTEGQAQPAAGNQSYSHAAVSPIYLRAMCQITGHAQDAMRSNYAGISVIDSEVSGAAADISSEMSSQFLGSTYGLELAIDDTATYAGISRGSAAYWESLVTAHNAALTTDVLLDTLEAMTDDPIGVVPELIMVPPNQSTNLYRLGGPHLVANNNPADKAPNYLSQSFAGVPVAGVPGLTSTIALFLSLGPTDAPLWCVEVWRPMAVRQMGAVGDSDLMQVSTGASFVCRSPKLQAKIEGIAA